MAKELLASVGLSEKMNDNIRNLSGGMKRSLLLVRSIINDPEIIILDEPTTGLDPHSRQMVWKRLSDLNRPGARPCFSRPTIWRKRRGFATALLSWTGVRSSLSHLPRNSWTSTVEISRMCI